MNLPDKDKKNIELVLGIAKATQEAVREIQSTFPKFCKTCKYHNTPDNIQLAQDQLIHCRNCEVNKYYLKVIRFVTYDMS